MTDMPDKIWEFLRQPENLEAALEVEKALSDVKRRLFEEFWDRIVRELEQKLERLEDNDPNNHPWEIWCDGNIFENLASLGVAQCRSKRRASLRVLNLTSNPIYGIVRGSNMAGARFQAWDPQDLKDKLHERGFTKQAVNSSWMSYIDLRNHSSLPAEFRIDSDRAVLALAREEADQNKPLTQQIVSRIWELFCKFRGDLEHLNDNYNYPVPNA